MRALGCLLFVAVLAATSPGCALFGKQEGSAERSGGIASWFKKKDTAPIGGGPAPPKFPDPLVTSPGAPPPTPPPSARAPNSSDVATLAGSVVDAYNRPIDSSYIRLVNLDNKQEGGPPVDVATSPGGYFVIPNLKPGGQYQLIARTKLGEKLLAGITYTQAPNTRLVILVKEEFATSSIPPMPTPSAQEKSRPVDTATPNPKTGATTSWGTTNPPDADLPAKVSVPLPGATDSPWPPTLQIGPKKSTTPLPPVTPNAPKAPPLWVPTETQGGLAPLVPSCVLIGDQLQTLALNDVDGQTWNFHKDHKGKLILIDFWTANCMPCQKTMPILTQLQNKFGPQGLEVVGVAIDSGPVKDQSNRAKMLCYRLQTNYRQVLGQDDRTNIRTQFNLQYFPTLVLLDESGRIVWRHVGAPEQATLENAVQKLLASRGF